jgi:hypothetical protein
LTTPPQAFTAPADLHRFSRRQILGRGCRFKSGTSAHGVRKESPREWLRILAQLSRVTSTRSNFPTADISKMPATPGDD